MITNRLPHPVTMLALLAMVLLSAPLSATSFLNLITTVEFTNSTASLSENSSSYNLCVDISLESIDNPTSLDIVLISGDSTALNHYETQSVIFPANEATQQCISITIDDNTSCSGSSSFVFELQNITGGTTAELGAQNSFSLIVEDNELSTLTLANQDFEALPTDTWTYLLDPINYNVDGDTWDVLPTLGSISAPSEGLSFLGMQDLNNPNGGNSNYHTLTFSDIDISTYFNSSLQFDYNVVGFDLGDTMRYEVFYDGVSQGVVNLIEGGIAENSTVGWETITLPITGGTETVSLQISTVQDGAGDQAGLDNIKIIGQQCACNTDAGDLAIDLEISDYFICLGDDLLDENDESVSFSVDYTAIDENNPGVFGTEYIYLLANSTGSIINVSLSGDFNFSVITNAGDYTIYGLSYAISNSPNQISEYINPLVADEDLNDIAQIEADDLAEVLCLSLTGLNVDNNPIIITIEENLSILNTQITNPTSCSGNDGSVIFSINPTQTSATDYSIEFQLGANSYSINTTSAEAIIGSGIFETLTMSDLISGVYSDFSITEINSGCIVSTTETISLSDPNAPTPSIVNSSEPTTCGGTDGTITLGGLTEGAEYTITFMRDGLSGTAGPYTADATNEITLINLFAANYNEIEVTDMNSGCVGGNMNTTLGNPDSPSINLLSNANVCINEITAYNLSQHNAIITAEAGTFTWYLGNPDANGTLVLDPNSVSVNDNDEYFVVFNSDITNCESNTSIVLKVYDAVNVTTNASLCLENAEVYSASFSVITNTNDIVNISGDNGVIYTSNLSTNDNINYTLENVPNNVNLTIEVTRENEGCENVFATITAINCCQADAGDLLPAGAKEICEGMDSPEFSVDYSALDENDPIVDIPSVLRISEIRIDHPGGVDINEFVELQGAPGTSLDGLSYVVIGDGIGGSGVIESVTNLSGNSIPETGYFVLATNDFSLGNADLTVADLNFENSDNVTHLLVQNFTGLDGDDIDTNDDGLLNIIPWSAIIDEIALIETIGSGDLVYSNNNIGPNDTFVPSHIYFNPETDTYSIGEFDPSLETASDSPNEANIPADYIYVWLVSQENIGITTYQIAENNSLHNAVFSDLEVGEYCVNGFSFYGTEAEFLAENYLTSQAIVDAINAGDICGDIDLSACIPLTVTDIMTVSNFQETNCSSLNFNGTFEISFQIAGGASPITINGQDISQASFSLGTITGIGTDISPYIFTSNAIASLENYTFTVADNSVACSDDVTFNGSRDCDPCTGFLPIDEISDITECIDTDIILSPNGGGLEDLTINYNFYNSDPSIGNPNPIAIGAELQVTDLIVPPTGIATTIYITAFSTIPACESTVVDVVITRNPNPNTSNAALYECIDSNGFADFDLTTASSIIDIEGGNTVTYHATLLEAQENFSSLISPYSAENGAILFARVEDINNCYSISELTLNTVDCEVSITDPCSCRANPINPIISGNASTNQDGQFNEEVEVMAPTGQTWYIQSVSGLFDINSAQPPVAPTPLETGIAGETLVEIPNGDGTSTYILAGIHIDAQGYFVTLTNGVDVLQMNNNCYYPSLIIEAPPSSVCLFTPPFLVIGEEINSAIPDAVGFQILDENNAIVQTASTNEILINPTTLGLGTYTIEFTFDAGEPGQMNIADPGCTQIISQNFVIEATPSQMACNDNIQISVGDDCTSLITPDMVLEGIVGCEDDYEVQITNVFNQNLGDTTSPDMIGETYSVRVYHLPSNNFCLGSISIEDKQKPFFECPTASVLIDCYDEFDNIPAPIGLDNCDSNPTVQLIDQTINDTDPCTPTFVTRTYIAIDESENQSEECIQIIELVSPSLPDFPEDITFTCEQYAANETITDARNLHPSILDSDLTDTDIDVAANTSNAIMNVTGAGMPDIVQGTYCQYSLTFNDDTISTCGTNFHILRSFVVLDWCSNSIISTDINGDDNIQIIEVRDNTPPIVTQSNFTVSANVYGLDSAPCRSTDFLFPAIISDNCNDIVEVKIFTPLGEANYVNGVDGTQGGFITEPGLTIGIHTIIYSATDVCGNIGTTSIEIEVVDDLTPTPVCDLITTTVLGNNGLAIIPATTFDDGSNDNCGIEQMLVRRISDNCGIQGNTDFGTSVTFCCEDLSLDFVNVEFKVVDYFGNENTCNVTVIVEENLVPTMVSCPFGTSITCDNYNQNLKFALEQGDASVLNQYGAAVFNDNCSLNTTESFVVNVDNCGEGTIIRTFGASDNQGNSGPNCTQTISVNHVSDFVVQFPEDLDYVCSPNENPQENGYFGEPTIFYDDCEMVAISQEDMTFTVVQDACYKIWRTWTVINWCVYENFNTGNPVIETAEINLPGGSLDTDFDTDSRTFKDGLNAANYPNAMSDGIIIYTQEIRVMDNDAPIFDEISSFELCIDGNDCTTTIHLPAGFAIDCSPNITYSATSDLGTGFGPFTNVEAGTYDVTYTATDNCGNVSSTDFEIVVEDCKAPTPYCLGGLIIELAPIDTDQDGQPDAGEAVIWASDFDAGSYDNCSENVQVSFSSDVNDTNLTFTCDSVGFLPIYLWVTDEQGNQDLCQTTVQIESVDNVCGGLSPVISGYIEREDGEGVLQVEVNVSSSNNNMDLTNDIGFFEIENLEMGYDYSVIPEKDVEDILGVTTYDILLIRAHILGLNYLDSPYKMIAADANNSESVTTADIIEIKKLILANIPTFQNNTSWRFVDKYFHFPNEANPWETTFPEFKLYNNLDNPVYVADFTAVKIGDVNNSAIVNFEGEGSEERTNATLYLETTDQKVKKGETFEVPIRLRTKADLMGMQWTLNYDKDALNFVEIREGNYVKKEDFGLAFLENGAITNSFHDITGTKLALEETLFYFTFVAQEDGMVSEWLQVNSSIVKSEAYLSFTETAKIELSFLPLKNQEFGTKTVLYQNSPNPFLNKTEIGFYLEEDKEVILTIFDVAGKEIWKKRGLFDSGKHEIHITKKELKKTGILYYQIETNSGILIKKMVLL